MRLGEFCGPNKGSLSLCRGMCDPKPAYRLRFTSAGTSHFAHHGDKKGVRPCTTNQSLHPRRSHCFFGWHAVQMVKGWCADDDTMSGCEVEQQSRWRQLGQRDKKRISLDVLRKDKVDPPIHTEYFHSGGATTMSFIVNGANTVSSFVMRSILSCNMFVPLGNTALAYDSLRMYTSSFMLLWPVKLAGATLPRNGNGWHRR